MRAPLLILQTGSTLPELRARRGDFDHWFRCALRAPQRDIRVLRVDAGDPLPDFGEHRAAIVTGSAAMVTERLDWSEATAAWLREAVRGDRLPVLGVCYGHQLLAHALGGTVGWNPRGREMGTQWLDCTPAAATDPLLAGLPARFRAQTTHRQTVLEAPPGATLLATSERDGAQALRVGERAWGLQFHPEFSADVMAGYVRARSEALQGEDFDVAALLASTGPTAAARRLLRKFAQFT